MGEPYLAALGTKGIKPDHFVMLVTAERTFDADGCLRLPSDERMSTLLTPTGLGIEGGVQGAVTNRFGYGFRTPVDELVTVPMTAAHKIENARQVTFNVTTKLPDDLPPGIYRLRFDYGVTVKNRLYNLNAEAFARRGFPQGPLRFADLLAADSRQRETRQRAHGGCGRDQAAHPLGAPGELQLQRLPRRGGRRGPARTSRFRAATSSRTT